MGQAENFRLAGNRKMVDPRGRYRWRGKSGTPAGSYSASRRRNRTLRESCPTVTGTRAYGAVRTIPRCGVGMIRKIGGKGIKSSILQ